MSPPLSPDWFYRRPCAWIAVAAAAAVVTAAALEPPAWAWAALAGAGLAAAAARRREAWLLLSAAALFGARASAEMAPPRAPAFRDGAPVTLRGRVERPPGRGRLLFVAEQRLTLSGWVREGGRFGLSGAAAAAPGDLAQVSGRLRAPPPAGNPGGFDGRLFWLRQGARLVLHAHPAGYAVLGRREPAGWRGAVDGLRRRILALNRETLSPRAALVVNEFLIGDGDPPDPALSDRVTRVFRASGTLHLLVVSGSQVMLLLGLFIWLGWRFWPLRVAAWLLGAAAVVLFYLLTGGDAAVSRAAVMGGAFIVGLVASREPDGENCLGLAALVLLAHSPFVAFDPGARLSFAAVWALMRLAPPLQRALGPAPAAAPGRQDALVARRIHQALAAAVAAAVAAHLGVAPILAHHFQTAAWSGIPANLVMVPLGALLLPLAAAHGALAGAGLPVLAPVVQYLADALYGWAGFFASLGTGAADVYPAPGWLLAPWLALLALPGLAGERRTRTLAILAGLTAGLFLLERVPAPPPRAPALRALDVGQGDALLLQDPGGTALLVDAGPPAAGSSPVAAVLRALRLPALDAVIVTHAHADHAGGLPALLADYPVRLLVHAVDRVDPGDGPAWDETLRLAARRRIPVVRPRPGDRLAIGRSTLTVLGPLSPAAESGPGAADDANEQSLVLRWDAWGARFLLAGDAGLAAERELLRWGPELRAHVLKVGHHGSAGASGEAWLRAVRPRRAVISCGRENRYGHPAAETLGRLREWGIPVSRTDLEGMVSVTVTGDRVRAVGHRPAPAPPPREPARPGGR